MGSWSRSFRSGAVGLVLVALAAVMAPSALAAEPSIADVVAHDAVTVPFPTGLQTDPPRSDSTKVSCPADGECVVMGTVPTAGASVEYRTFASVERAGTWGEAQLLEYPGVVDLATYAAAITGFECVAPGECDGTGWLEDSIAGRAFHFRIAGGILQPAEWLTVTGPAVDWIYARTIACTSPGVCLIAGTISEPGVHRPVEWNVIGGVAAAGTEIVLPSSLTDPNQPMAESLDVECPLPGSCVELGWAESLAWPAGQLWVRVQALGVWGSVQTVGFDPSIVFQTGPSVFGILECWNVGDCTVIGEVPLVAGSGAETPFSVTLADGVLGLPTLLPSAPGVPATSNWWLHSAVCSGIGRCLATATVWDPASSTSFGSWRIEAIDGAWSAPVELISPIAGVAFYSSSVSCVRMASCLVVGHTFDAVGGLEYSKGIVYVERDGIWHDGMVVANSSGIGDNTDLRSVGCARDGSTCVAVGTGGDPGLVPGEIDPAERRSASSSSTTLVPSVVADARTAIVQVTEFAAPVEPVEPVGPAFTG